ncbi:hypothetical protein NXF25_007248 [Crotalus adamanteus]|uniref:EF-hand domain-containing protein n=1 Tax=Crotalus adamanteus TaxID=8729 RepID=A0AAW1C2A4_CROAD
MLYLKQYAITTGGELTDFLACQKDPQLVDKIMHDLDINRDNEVDFNEFEIRNGQNYLLDVMGENNFS